MKNQARQEQPERPDEVADPDAPEALRFPPRERPTTVRRPAREDPFDLQELEADAERNQQARAETARADEHAREQAEREEAVRQARAALRGAAAAPDLAAVVWDAHEAIAAHRDGEDDEERPAYVPIASASSGITAPRPIERVPASVYVAPYNLPERSPNPAQTPVDLLRRVVGAALTVAFLVLSLFVVPAGAMAVGFGSGDAGLAPLGAARIAWPLIALGLVAAAAHGWVPDQLSARRQRALGVPLAVMGAAGIAWCLTASSGIYWAALLSAVLMAAAGFDGVRRLNLHTARTPRERWLTDVPVEAAMGWAAFCVAWTLSAAMAAWGWDLRPTSLWGVVILLLVLAPVALMGSTERGRVAPALAFAWGAVWLMAARIFGDLHDPWILIVAGGGAVLALLTALARRQEIGDTERRALQVTESH